MQQITNEEIKNGIATLPAKIARAAQEAEDLKLTYKKQEKILRVQTEQLKMDLKKEKINDKKKYTQAELESMVIIKLKVEQLALLDMESAYRKKLTHVKELDDKYTGYKRIAQLRILEIQSGIDYKGR